MKKLLKKIVEYFRSNWRLGKASTVTMLLVISMMSCSKDDSISELSRDREATTEECVNGGVITLFGIDSNNNNYLDYSEITARATFCNEPGTKILTRYSENKFYNKNLCFFSEMITEYSFVDLNENGKLDEFEVENEQDICTIAPRMATGLEDTFIYRRGSLRLDKSSTFRGKWGVDENNDETFEAIFTSSSWAGERRFTAYSIERIYPNGEFEIIICRFKTTYNGVEKELYMYYQAYGSVLVNVYPYGSNPSTYLDEGRVGKVLFQLDAPYFTGVTPNGGAGNNTNYFTAEESILNNN